LSSSLYFLFLFSYVIVTGFMNFLQLNPVFPLCKKHVATRRYKNVVGTAAVLLATLMSMGSAVGVAVSHATAGEPAMMSPFYCPQCI